MPAKQPKRARLWRADGSCVRLRPTHRHPVWSYDFVAERTPDGRPFRIVKGRDAYTRECLASVAARRLGSQEVILLLAELRAQFLNGERFYTLKEAQILTEQWRIHNNTVRPHSRLGGQPPVPETVQLAS